MWSRCLYLVITLNKKIENIGLANPIVLYEEYNGRLSEDSIIQGHCLADHLALNDLEFYPLTTMRILLTSNDNESSVWKTITL